MTPSDSPVPLDISLWAQGIEKEYQERDKDRLRLLSQAIDLIAEYFQEKKVESVYLTGSILRAGHFYPFSDVDIAVAGLREDYWRVMVELEDLLDRTVDLIELERCRFCEVIKKHGKKIV